MKPQPHEKRARNEEIRRIKREKGASISLRELGDMFGITGQRVFIILNNKNK